jgi:23S rRNA (guanosine2251-2'-O)-methyltransferase
MVERRRRRKAERRLPGNHQRRWLWGRHAVGETLRAGRWPVAELYLSDELPEGEREPVRAAAAALGAEVRVVPPERLRQLGKSSEHQGYLARMGPFPYADLADLEPAANARPLLVLLDGVQDPHNLGAILRSAEVLGVQGLVIGSEGQVGVTTHVARASAGAVNHLPIARVDDLAAAAGTIGGWGLMVVGASESGESAIGDVDLTGPVALVIGNEGRGLSPGVRGACDRLARIPQTGHIGSLNAAVAAGILFYETSRQRGGESIGE